MPGNPAIRRGLLARGGGSSFIENSVIFGGSADLNKTSDLGTDSKTVLIFASLNFTNTASATEVIFAQSASYALYRDSIGRLEAFWNPSVDLLTSAHTAAERMNILVAIDADATSRLWLWTASSPSWASAATDASGGGANFDHTIGTFFIGTSGSGANRLSASVHRVAAWTGITVPDITDSAVRAKFADATTGVIVDPATSVAAYGTPRVDVYGPASEYNALTNHGAAGDFTSKSGTFT